jgi:hypothetical protein
LQLDNEARTWGLGFETQLSSIASHNSPRYIKPETTSIGTPLQRLKELPRHADAGPSISEVNSDPIVLYMDGNVQFTNRPVQNCAVTVVRKI